MLLRALQAAMPSLLHRSGATFTTTTCLRGLEELIPKVLKEGDAAPVAGRGWRAQELRTKSWDDLHKLWYVLLKERNALHAEKLAYRAARQAMPSPARLTTTRRSMARIKGVMAERLREHEDPVVKMQLKAFIDAM